MAVIVKGTQVENLETIYINGEAFTDIGYDGYYTCNTKNYVESPSRSNDGSMSNIEDHDTFFVPQVKFNFKYISLSDYQRMREIVTASNQFRVKYWDKDFGTWVTHYMYMKEEELTKFYNIGRNVLGILDYEVEFVGTLNNIEEYTVGFCPYYTDKDGNVVALEIASGSELTSSDISTDAVVNVSTAKWGESFQIDTTYMYNNFVIPDGYTFICFNTKVDGTGNNYYDNTNATVFRDTTLYPKLQYSA